MLLIAASFLWAILVVAEESPLVALCATEGGRRSPPPSFRRRHRRNHFGAASATSRRPPHTLFLLKRTITYIGSVQSATSGNLSNHFRSFLSLTEFSLRHPWSVDLVLTLWSWDTTLLYLRALYPFEAFAKLGSLQTYSAKTKAYKSVHDPSFRIDISYFPLLSTVKFDSAWDLSEFQPFRVNPWPALKPTDSSFFV